MWIAPVPPRCCWAIPTRHPRRAAGWSTSRARRSAGRVAETLHAWSEALRGTPTRASRGRLRRALRPATAHPDVPDLLDRRRHPQPRRGAACPSPSPYRDAGAGDSSTASCPTTCRSCSSSRRPSTPLRGGGCCASTGSAIDVLATALDANADRRMPARIPRCARRCRPPPHQEIAAAAAGAGRPTSGTGRPASRSRCRLDYRRETGDETGVMFWERLPVRDASRSWSSGPSGATATTSSAGPPARRSSTSRGCCGSAARCSTSASWWSSSVTSSAWSSPILDRRRRAQRTRVPRSAVFLGSIAGLCTLVGMAMLIYRRRTTGPVFMATTTNDKLMYVVLVAGDRRWACGHARGSNIVGDRLQLPRDRLGVVPVDVLSSSRAVPMARRPGLSRSTC